MNYTSGNNAPTQMAQMTNRVGNKSKNPAEHKGGVTAITRPKGNVSHAPGYQTPPSAGGSITGRHQPVSVSRPAAPACHPTNNGYLKNSSFLK